jgi:hypothetical protein
MAKALTSLSLDIALTSRRVGQAIGLSECRRSLQVMEANNRCLRRAWNRGAFARGS